MNTLPGRLTVEDWVKVSIIAVVILIDAIWIVAAHYRFGLASAMRPALLVALLLTVSELYRRWRPNFLFVVMTREIAWLVAFLACGALLSNLTITCCLPLVDPALGATGHFVGFSWIGWYHFVTSRQLLSEAFAFIYLSCLPEIGFVVIALSLYNRIGRVRELVLAAMISALIAIAISTIFPSAGALAYFHKELTTAPTIVGLDYKQAFFDLRAGRITDFSLDNLKGLIAFPSYHATIAVLSVLAFRGMPRFFWPMLAFNLVMLATAPVEGGHYSVDIVGGVLVAVLGLATAVAIRSRLVQIEHQSEQSPDANAATVRHVAALANS